MLKKLHISKILCLICISYGQLVSVAHESESTFKPKAEGK